MKNKKEEEKMKKKKLKKEIKIYIIKMEIEIKTILKIMNILLKWSMEECWLYKYP